jgi:hypothetical protein
MRRVLVVIFGFAISAVCTHAQTVRLGAKPSFTVKPELLTVLTVGVSPTSANITLVPNGTTSPVNVTITSNLTLAVASTVKMYGYFSSTSAFTTSHGDAIPTSAVYGKCTTGVPTSYTAFTQNTPFVTGSGLLIFQESAVVGVLAPRTDVLSLVVNLSSYPNQPAGSYTGTLILEVQAM